MTTLYHNNNIIIIVQITKNKQATSVEGASIPNHKGIIDS